MTAVELGTLVTYNPVTISPQTPILEAALVMGRMNVQHLPVVNDDDQLIGMLTDTELLRAVGERHWATEINTRLNGPEQLFECTVEAAMSRPVTAVPLDAPVPVVLQKLLDDELPSLPVVEVGRLIGLITTNDFVREVSYGTLAIARESISGHMMRTIEPLQFDETIDDAAINMRIHGVVYAVVERAGFPLGVVTLRNIRAAKYRETVDRLQGRDTATPLLGSLVNPQLQCRPGARLCDAAAVMAEYDAQAIPIVNQGHRVMGVLTEQILLNAYARCFAKSTEAVRD